MGNTGSDSGDKSISVLTRISGILFALLKVCIAVLIIFVADYGIAYLMLFLGVDFDIYEGVFTASSSLLAAVLLYAFSRIEGRVCGKTRSGLIRFNEINVKDLLLTVVIAFALTALVSIYLMIASLIAERVSPVNEAMDKYSDSMVTYDVETEYPKWDQFLYVFAVTALVPVAEEFAFRGVIYGAVNRRLNAAWAIGISAFVFGVMHGLSVHVIYAVISGVVLGITYYAFNSIYATIIVHGLFNFFGSGIYNLADALSVDRDAVPGFYGLQFAMILPAVLVLVSKCRARRSGGAAHEQA
ncbi:MAG: CPBP family intramembrane metalloprotease [Clostridiales bacterium]|nr:CPBP family intramembrane metalloprotease [Clostridiales bacterium]